MGEMVRLAAIAIAIAVDAVVVVAVVVAVAEAAIMKREGKTAILI